MAGKNKKLEGMVEQVFKIECEGRDGRQNPCLDSPVPVEVTARQLTGGAMISLIVKCPYLCGKDKNNCRAMNTQGIFLPNMAICPYSLNLPYKIDNQYRGEQNE
ncbi:MAG: hypothetical protein PHO02_03140 [Candidatus Nanoarchaeia archaeon]|nr:hypothetical protein [Candidatus Nanoarchaeia archaeon]